MSRSAQNALNQNHSNPPYQPANRIISANQQPSQPQQRYTAQSEPGRKQYQDDERIHEQEKMIRSLADQVYQMDRALGSLKTGKNELERKLDLKSGDQQIVGDLENKVYSLESKLITQDRFKNELQQKILTQEQNIKELMYLVKNTQQRDNQDYIQMRGMIQEKITEEQSGLQKEREKSKALFMEVVRLGEQQTKMSETLSQLNINQEQRLQQLENKIYQGERALTSVAQKGDSGMNYINEWNEKTEQRVMVLESNLLTMGKEQLKDRDQLKRLDVSNSKLQEDIKIMIQNLHSDYQSRLEAKGTEIVNRIIMEHEQRVKIQDEIKQNIDIQFKMNNERLQYEREEIRERLAAVEQTFRADSQRKEEALRQLSTLIETQVNAIYMNIRNEEAQRSAHEIALRNDLLKIQENIKQENELFKSHQATITEKMTDMIKIEVQNRLSSDVDLKNLTSAIATDIVSDLNSLKDVIDQQNKKYSVQIKDIEKDSSEKAEKLSRYLDDEIAKIQSVQVKKYEKTKIIFTKLAEQFKQHLINTEANRQEFDQRINNLEQNQDQIRTDFQGVIEELQVHLLTRIAEEKNEIVEATANQIKVLEDKSNKLETEQNKNFEILKNAVEENHTIFSEKMKLILEQNESHQKETREQIELIVGGIQVVRENISLLENQLRSDMKTVEIKVDEIKIELNQYSTELDIIKEQQKAISERVDGQVKQLTEMQEQINKVKESNEMMEKQFEEFQQSLKQQDELIKSLLDSNAKQQEEIGEINNKIEKSQEEINGFKNQLEIFTQILDELKQKDEDLVKRLEEQDSNFKKEQQEQQNSMSELSTKVTDISSEIKSKDLEINDIQENVKNLDEKVKTLTKLES